MAATYTPIASVTLGANASTVTFSSIPQTYTDLILIVSAAGTATNDPYLRVNSDSGTNYSYTTLTGNGTNASSARATNQTTISINYFGSDSTTLGNNARVIEFLNYSNTTTYKTILARGGRGNTDGLALMVNLWRSTAAISSIVYYPGSGSLLSGSTFNLYGILGANA